MEYKYIKKCLDYQERGANVWTADTSQCGVAILEAIDKVNQTKKPIMLHLNGDVYEVKLTTKLSDFFLGEDHGS